MSRRTILLAGLSGDGKSTTGNVLSNLPRPPFTAGGGFNSVTTGCDVVDCNLNGMDLRILDTLGFFDTQKSCQEVLQLFNSFADKTLGGVHVFLFILKLGRFTPQNDMALKVFVQNCGDEALRETVLVFTNCPSDQDLQRDLAANTNPMLQEWLQRIQWRVGIENISDPKGARELLDQKIHDVLNATNGVPYSNESLLAARRWREEIMRAASVLNGFQKIQAQDFIDAVGEGRIPRADAEAKVDKLVQIHQEHLEQQRRAQEAEQQRIQAQKRAEQERQRAAEQEQQRIQAEREMLQRFQALQMEQQQQEAVHQRQLEREREEGRQREAEHVRQLERERGEREWLERARKREEREEREERRKERDREERSRIWEGILAGAASGARFGPAGALVGGVLGFLVQQRQ